MVPACEKRNSALWSGSQTVHPTSTQTTLLSVQLKFGAMAIGLTSFWLRFRSGIVYAASFVPI
jgi:hypothetical protein